MKKERRKKDEVEIKKEAMSSIAST